jgi:poly(3-hydroxybutyrate) depolymerase
MIVNTMRRMKRCLALARRAACVAACVAGLALPAAAATAATSTAPAVDAHGPTEVRLSTDSGGGTYWLRVPPGYGPGDRPTLIIALHGTDDTAREAVEFWAAVGARKDSYTSSTQPLTRVGQPYLPAIIAAPQAAGRGWADTDLPTIQAMLTDLPKRVSYDPQRVLLAGFSAGGAMAFHLVYVERAPVTAAAALAIYLPPSITQEQIRLRRSVPVFYAVGKDDINHERMRSGIDRLRIAGADVELYQPRIGHVLDPQVAAAAIEFFFDRCRREVGERIQAAGEMEDLAVAACILEGVVSQSRWHEPAQVAAADETLRRVEAAGRRELESAQALIRAGRKLEAMPLLVWAEERYGSSRLGAEAARLRRELQTDPTVSRAEGEQLARRRASAAEGVLAAAQRALADEQPAAAAESCRHILDMYPETPAAERARRLLATLQTRPSP